MKTFAPIVTITAALSLFGGTALRAQPAADSAPPPELEKAVKMAQEDMQKAEADALVAQDTVQRLAQRRQAETRQQLGQVERELKQAAQSYQLAQSGASSGATGGGGVPGKVFADRLQNAFVRAPGTAASKTLVILSADTPQKAQANFEEDLAVMTRILDKAVGEKLGGQPSARTAMGINVAFAPGASPIRNLYLDGYGALFMLNVNFPLLSPPAKTETPKEEAPAGSAWEEAKRELYGSRAAANSTPAPAENYSEEKVGKLKDVLLEAFKDAANIRNLKPDDSVTVCVFGSPGAASTGNRKTSTTRIAPMDRPLETTVEESVVVDVRTRQWAISTGGGSGTPARGTTMTIRAKKSDVDAFAKGKLSVDEFRKKAVITSYAGNASIASGNWPFASSGGGGVFATDAFSYSSGDGSVGGGGGFTPAP